MRTNKLKMNDEKSELILFGSSRSLPKCTTHQVKVGDMPVTRSESIKLLGVKLDQSLTFKQHIADKCRNVSLRVFWIKQIRRFLSEQQLLKLTNALFMSHIDYNNTLFINLPDSTLKPLQNGAKFRRQNHRGCQSLLQWKRGSKTMPHAASEVSNSL